MRSISPTSWNIRKFHFPVIFDAVTVTYAYLALRFVCLSFDHGPYT
jgi:hypothetical protein